MKNAHLVGIDGKTRLYVDNGVCIRVNNHTVVTVTQLTDEELKRIVKSNARQTTAKQGQVTRKKDRTGQEEMPVLPGTKYSGDE